MVITSYLALSAILFSIGLYGVLTKKNAVMVLFCIELMFNAANINFVAFSKFGLFPNLAARSSHCLRLRWQRRKRLWGLPF